LEEDVDAAVAVVAVVAADVDAKTKKKTGMYSYKPSQRG
jgi:hypothetical protein